MSKELELVIEERLSSLERIQEAQGAGKTIVFEAIVATADTITANWRLYPRQVLEEAFNYLNAHIEEHPGAARHPEAYQEVAPDQIAVAWESFRWEGNDVIGRGRVIETDAGRNLAAIIESGVRVGFSTRGYGQWAQEEREGRIVFVMEKLSFLPDGSVDVSVTRPANRAARIKSYTKESEEMATISPEQFATVEAERNTARAEAELQKNRADEAERKLGEAQTALESVRAELVAANEAKAVLEAAQTEVQIREKLDSLTESHRFGASIKAQVSQLRKDGVPVTLENIESVVSRFTALVESAATGSAGNPRGDTSTDEDKPAPVTESEDAEAQKQNERRQKQREYGL